MPTRVVPPRDSRAPHFPWSYRQPGFDQPIGAHSRDQLTEAVTNFRIAHELDINDPDKDIEDYLRNRGHYSTGVPDKALPAEVKAREDKRSVLDKVRTWSKLAKNHTWSKVGQKEADRRAEICLSCPKNAMVEQITQCAPCISSLNRTAVILTNNATTEAKIGTCTAVFQDNRVAVFMPKEELGRSKLLVGDTPEICWLRKL